MPRHFVVLTLLRTALSAPCLGEYSKCPSGACALIATGPFSQCAQCAAGAYACPLSTTACFTDAASYAACPGLAGTHFDSTLSLDARVDYMFKAPWSVAEFIGQMTDNATSLSRLSIPNYSWLNDDQHGVKQPDATAFPNGGAMGASYSTELLRRVGLAIGTEARGVHNTLDDKSGETGGHSWPGTIQNGVGLTMYAPNVNLVHEPRWGRANEVMSECPHLSGSLVAAYVQGLQNATPAAPVGTAGPLLAVACCKHYAIYNTETIPTDRHHFDAVVGARDLWETYLPVFEACIGEGMGQSVMCSYNSINGIPACGHKGMLADVLRGHMGFKGFVMSDYDAWAEIVETHHYVPTYEAAAALGLAAGLDQEGGGGPTYPPVQQGIPAAVAAGTVTLAQLETAVRRLMRARVSLGMFDSPYAVAYNFITHASVASAEHLALAEELARAGITLLKNEGKALPLSLGGLAAGGLALLGPNANASYALLGSYSDPGCCTTGGIPTLLDTLGAKAAAAGVPLRYAPGCTGGANCADQALFPAATAAAASSRAAVLVLGLDNTQYDCKGAKDRAACEAEDYDRTTCALPGEQAALVAAVRGALPAGAPLVGVLVHGGALCLGPATVGAFDALLSAWYPGQRGAAAIADALVGAFSPSGRSPVTWYASDADLPADRGAMSPYPNASSGSPGITYRFYEKEPVFSFAEGLSYTTFSASNATAPASVKPCDPIPVTVTVTNTGGVASACVVTLFLSQEGTSVPAPATRLVSFARIFLEPGKSAAVPLPPVAPEFRAVVREDGSDLYSYAGKRWGEAGTLHFRVTLGEHGGDRAGGLPFDVTVTATQDLSTC